MLSTKNIFSTIAIVIVFSTASALAAPIYFNFGSGSSCSNYNNVTDNTSDSLTDVIDSAGADTFIDMKVIQNGMFWDYGNTKGGLEWCSNAQNRVLISSRNASPTDGNSLWVEFSNLVAGSEVTIKAMCWGGDQYNGYDTHVELWNPATMAVLDSKKVNATFMAGLTGNPTGTITANANASGKIVFACDGGNGTYGYLNAATLTGTPVPEPVTIALLAVGGLTLLRKERRA